MEGVTGDVRIGLAGARATDGGRVEALIDGQCDIGVGINGGVIGGVLLCDSERSLSYANYPPN